MIILWDISALFQEEVRNRYLPFLDEDRLTRVKRYKYPEDQARCVGAGILLQEAYRQFQMNKEQKLREPANADSLVVLKEENIISLAKDFIPKEKLQLPKMKTLKVGKPVFESDKEPYFNLSHAKNLVACIVDEKEVGIDIEYVRPIKNAVVERFFTKDEKERLKEAQAYVDRLFTEMWTRKEAESKLDGRGIAYIHSGNCDQAEDENKKKMNIQSIWVNENAVLSVAQYDE